MTAHRLLAFWAILPAAATLYFIAFWRYFEFWRRRRLLAYALMAATFGVVGGAVVLLRRWVLGPHAAFPVWVRALGWMVFALSCLLGTVADRQIGVRVRSFTPFFERHGHIELKTTGAYGVVRHPIYAAGSGFQFGMFLVTGHFAVLVAWLVFTLGATWFTKQEERRLVPLLDDPGEYERYRQRVPALFPRPVRRAAKLPRTPSADSASP